jgi:DNA-binding MarR family transcriptional regulator
MRNEVTQPTQEVFQRVVTQCTCGNLRKAAQVITRLYDEFLQPSGLLITQFKLLGAVAAHGAIALSPLAKQLDLDPTTLARNLVPLARDGLVEVYPGEDRRKRLVRITPRGQEALDAALPLWENAQAWVISQLGDERWRGMLGDWANLVLLARQH